MYMEHFSLARMVGIVTGGGQGLGRIFCHAFAEAGADIIVAETNPATGEQPAGQIPKMGREGCFFETDVRQNPSIEQMVQRSLKEFGQIDFLMNNAGLARLGPAVDLPEEQWRDIFDVNLNGTFFCCQAVGRHMIERRCGRIINISSVSGHVANRHREHLSYNVSKAGLPHLTTTLACEWAKYNVRVNGIAPGYMATEQAKKALAAPGDGDQVILRVPLGGPGEPEELGPLAIFRASLASAYMTGTTFVVDGGYTCW